MTANLASALAAFQASMPVVAKNKTADTGKYRYTYADLADVTAAAMPLLVKHGLAFSACPRATDSGYELAGVLLHTSGERLEGALPLHGRTPQEMGSALTYARRYLLGCLTGIVTDDDDDAQAANAAKRTTSQPAKDWQAVLDTAAALTDLDALRELWSAEGMAKAPAEVQAKFNAHVADVKGGA